MTEWVPKAFIDEPIQVAFDEPPLLEKKPEAPDGFTWAGETFRVAEVLAAWVTYERRGRFARNMTLGHLRAAARRGSWGVGRFYFRVRTTSGRVFDLYYDRAPAGAGDRKGRWVLWRELQAP